MTVMNKGGIMSWIEFWKDWYFISKYQKDILDNYKNAFFGVDVFQRFIQLVPSYLWQNINPWSFSLFQFTKEIKGSPALEQKIITEVAGYGSQLGTIIDFLETIERECQIDPKKLKTSEDIYKFYKFKDLAEKINKIKV